MRILSEEAVGRRKATRGLIALGPALACSPPPVSSQAGPSASPTPSSPALPTPLITSDPTASGEFAAHMEPLVASWAPQGPTLVVQSGEWDATNPVKALTLVAIPIPVGAPTPLLRLASQDWAIEANGRALVAAVRAGSTGWGLVIWDLLTGRIGWLIRPEPSTVVLVPRWSPDGSEIYFGRFLSTEPTRDDGIWRVRRDGSLLTRVHPPVADPGWNSFPLAVTSDGVLFWARAAQGYSVEAFDLTTGRELGPVGLSLLSLRERQPRVLTQLDGIAPPIRAGLVIWNDRGGAGTTLIESRYIVTGAAWDPTGATAVAAIHDRGTVDASYLVTVTTAGARTRLGGSEGAASPFWVGAGVAYCWANETWDDQSVPYEFPRRPPPHEVRLLAPAGGAPRTLYRSDDPLECRAMVTP